MSVGVNKKSDAGDQPEDSRVGETAQRWVLLVEEQAHVVRVIRHNLELHGFQVDAAENVDGAIQFMMQRTFDALIVTGDQPLPDISELCRRGGELLATHALGENAAPVPMMLVSYGDEDNLAEQYPGFESLSQPVSLKRIVERLHDALGDASDASCA